MCDDENKAQARKSYFLFAEVLRRLASDYEGLGGGLIKPHGEDAKRIGQKARAVVRRLVEEWV